MSVTVEDSWIRCNLAGTRLEISRADEHRVRVKHEYGDLILTDETAIRLALALFRHTLTCFALRLKYALLVLLRG